MEEVETLVHENGGVFFTHRKDLGEHLPVVNKLLEKVRLVVSLLQIRVGHQCAQISIKMGGCLVQETSAEDKDGMGDETQETETSRSKSTFSEERLGETLISSEEVVSRF